MKEEVKVEVEEVKEVAKEEVKAEKPVEIEKLIQVPEPEQVEQPQDKFAGIDMLISTPESVEDVRQQYEEAKARMETAVEEARKANAEKLRLEKLLERLEKNVEPEAVAPVVIERRGRAGKGSGGPVEGEIEGARRHDGQGSGRDDHLVVSDS